MDSHRGLPLYGIDKEQAMKSMLKYDPQLEEDARQWIQTVIGENLPTGKSMCDQLKSGVALCKLVNKIKPGSIKKINNMALPFPCMENISNYLEVSKSLGVPASDSFQTVDLWEGKDMNQVVQHIHALGRASRSVPSFGGPYIGAKMAEKQASKFSPEQIRSAAYEVPLLTGAMHSLKVDNVQSHREIIKKNASPMAANSGSTMTKFEAEMRGIASASNIDMSRNIVKSGAAAPVSQGVTTKFDEEMRKNNTPFQADTRFNISRGGSAAAVQSSGLGYMDQQMRNMPSSFQKDSRHEIVRPGGVSSPANSGSSERRTSGGGSDLANLEYLEKLNKMRLSGIVSEEEFQAKKKELLGL